MNLFIGDNGAGKTSGLEGIAVALGGMFVNVAGVSTKNEVKEILLHEHVPADQMEPVDLW